MGQYGPVRAIGIAHDGPIYIFAVSTFILIMGRLRLANVHQLQPRMKPKTVEDRFGA